MAELQAKVEEEKEWWGRRKRGIQDGFMKELDEEKESASRQASITAGTHKSNSDDDAVLVERGSPAGTPNPGSAKKKKAGKK